MESELVTAEMIAGDAKSYLNKHRLPDVIGSIISGLMVERPDDHFAYIQNKLNAIQGQGADKVDWETFVYDLHPYRDPVRLHLIRDYSRFYIEFLRKMNVDEDVIKRESQSRSGFEYESYKPEVFRLTEPIGDELD
ncbi:uncharacterized protein LOC141914956 [Tubulanus polymorphus]|uniref:uncharacterized protein LOC141914956 n=1 Tax=Tubulanus polymorphus TaxID=672921 RepID=UPI003DA1E524